MSKRNNQVKFEQWMKEHTVGFIMSKDEEGEYIDDQTFLLWDGFDGGVETEKARLRKILEFACREGGMFPDVRAEVERLLDE